MDFMERRPEDTFIWKDNRKSEEVTTDQILVGPLPLVYSKTGIIVHGLEIVKQKWVEYIDEIQ